MAALLPIAGCRQQAQPATPAPSSAAQIQKIEAMLNSTTAARKTAMTDPIAFAWALFIYTNWPAQSGQRGEPDFGKPFGAAGPVVWQTWKTSQETYLAKGQTPLPWNQGAIDETPDLQSGMIDGTVLKDKNGNPIEYEVRLNADTFGYILSRNLYSAAGQMALLKGGQPVEFPSTAMEIKAAWRVLDSGDDPSHYLTATVNNHGVVQTLGLTGLHITSRVTPHWVWATFEQKDNQETTGAKLLLPIAAPVQKSNQEMQSEFAGTRWAYYRLDGVQTEYVQNPEAAPCPDGAKATCLANSQMETNFQASSSCITCHSLASIGAGGKRFNFWNYQGGNQKGYMGDPPPLKPDAGLDFVWSMREAK